MVTLALHTSLPGLLPVQSSPKVAATFASSFQNSTKTALRNRFCGTFPMTQEFQSGISWPLTTQVQTDSQSTLEIAEGEEERIKLDAEAMSAMAEVAASQQGKEGDESAPGAWKWAIRKRVWDLLESENVAQEPRPVHHRIPNFVGAPAAAAELATLPAFQAAQCVKVNPDTPQKQVRYLTLDGGKVLLTPQPRLRTGFFSKLNAALVPKIIDACTSMGVAKYGKPVGLNDKLKVDLIVIGSVAVDPATGARLGKGEGFAELEYGILRWMGAIDDSTLVVTTVHDKQLVDDIPVAKLLIHDVPVDIICTPTQIIHTNTKIPKPQGIYWEKLSPQKLGQIRVLRDLKKKIEKETGQTLPTGPDETLPKLAARKKYKKPTSKTDLQTTPLHTMFMWSIGPSTTWRELQEHVKQLGGEVRKVRLTRQPGTTRQLAWVALKNETDLEKVIEAVDRSPLNGATIRAKLDEPKRKLKIDSEPEDSSSNSDEAPPTKE